MSREAGHAQCHKSRRTRRRGRVSQQLRRGLRRAYERSVSEVPTTERVQPSSKAGRESDSRDETLDSPMRVLLSALGVGLLASGVVAAFVEADGVTTAALLAAGFGLVFVGYLGRYISRIRLREFEAELVSVQSLVPGSGEGWEGVVAAVREE